jgi:hypothetical protein
MGALFLHIQNTTWYPLDREGIFTIGTHGTDIIIQDGLSKAHHASLIRVKQQVMIKPESGTVYVNNQRVERQIFIQPADWVLIGNTTLQLVEKLEQQSSFHDLNKTNFISKQNTGFEFGDALFDEPVQPVPPPISIPPPPSTTHLTEDASADHFINHFQEISTEPTSTYQPETLAISSVSSQPIDLDNITDQQRTLLLQDFFMDGQIFKETWGSKIQLNLGGRWGKTRNTFGRTWVLATEALKAGVKAYDWMANMDNKKARPAQYVDLFIKQSIENCIPVAYDSLLMQPTLTQDPLVIYGPIFWRDSSIPINHICARKGEDGYIRFSAQQVSILVLDDDQIGVFMFTLDTLTGKIGSQKTLSYNYKDIVSIADEDTTTEVELENGNQRINVYAFNIEVSSGRNLSITLNSTMIRDLFNGDAMEQPEHRQTVNVIRQMWRTKKNQ